MTARTFMVLLIATVAGVLVAAALVMTRPGDQVYANLGDLVVPGLIDRVNDVQSVRLESTEGGILTFKRNAAGKGWSIAERDGYPAKSGAVNSLIVRLAQLTYKAPKTAKPELLKRLELDDPGKVGSQSRRVTFAGKDGKVMADVIIGTARGVMEGATDGGAYFRFPGQTQAWAGRGGMQLDNQVFDWIERKLFDIETKRVKRVVIRHPDGDKVEMFKDQAGDANFVLADVPGDKKAKSEYVVNGVASTIGDFQVQDMAKRGKVTVDPAKAVHLTFETFDGLVITALIEAQKIHKGGKEEKIHWLDVQVARVDGASASEGGAKKEFKTYKARTGDWVYEISDFRYDALAKRMSDLVEAAGGS
ncbi:MAG: DUF4340 domain-containing protein [Rhodospirillaceae bacterium]